MDTTNDTTTDTVTDPTVPSRQEMFNRAWEGLKSQGWKRATRGEYGPCVYQTDDGLRCAWGWVDPEGTANCPAKANTGSYDSVGQVFGGVWTLNHRGTGLAARLSEADLDFAQLLQRAHDRTQDDTLEASMRQFATDNRLTIPGEVVS